MNRRHFIHSTALATLGTAVPGILQARSNHPLPARLTLHPQKAGPGVPADFMGLSYETAQLADPEYFSSDNASLVAFVRRLGAQGVLRIGGNTSEYGFWTPHPNPRAEAAIPSAVGPDTGRHAPRRTAVTPAAIRNLNGFLEATGWRGIYGLNLGKGTPEKSAEEGEFVTKTLGERLIALQIGNEVELFGHNGLRPHGYDFDQFAAEWQRFYDAIHRRATSAQFAGPDTAHNVQWVQEFAQRFRDKIILLTNHYYAEGPPSNPGMTLQRLLEPNPKLLESIAGIQQVMRESHLPFRMAETNSCYGGGKQGVSNTFGAALWAGDFMFQLAAAGFSGINFHGGGYGWYTPIAGTRKSGFTARPEYYGLLLFTEAGARQMIGSTLKTRVPLFTAYAVRAADGALKAAVFNKSADQNASLTLDAGQRAERAEILRLAGPSLEATQGVTFGGAQVSANAAWSAQNIEHVPARGGKVVCHIPAASGALISLV
ncbi:MAG: glycosyl hydrolase family 79 C-terminal domain-containing protein [Terriglobia bacterium]